MLIANLRYGRKIFDIGQKYLRLNHIPETKACLGKNFADSLKNGLGLLAGIIWRHNVIMFVHGNLAGNKQHIRPWQRNQYTMTKCAYRGRESVWSESFYEAFGIFHGLC